MRKYTQLCLVIVTVISVIILLMYRSEYRQLKYVLDVVNFVGRKDEIAMVRLENQTNFYHHSNYEFNEPLPVWQRIGNGFHAYSSFWRRPNMLVEGGEVLTIVAGLKHSIVSFKCEAVYADNRSQKGKFVFAREEMPGGSASQEEFVIYKFICKLPRGSDKPWTVSFTDQSTKVAQSVAVRSLDNSTAKELLTMTLCVDLLPQKEPQIRHDDFNLLQFFVHHHLVGVEEFLVYDFNRMSATVKRILFLNGIKLNVFPFNFPFATSSPELMRQFVEMDCLLRTSNAVKYTSVATLDEYLYTNGNLGSNPQPLLQMLKNHAFADDAKLQIASNEICAHDTRRILSDNLILESENAANPSYLFRTNAIFLRGSNSVIKTADSAKLPRLSRELAFVNHYKICNQKKKADQQTNSITEWRSSISEDFRTFVDQLSVSTNSILRTIQN